MKKTFTTLVMLGIVVSVATAQINSGSPVPIDFLINSPSDIVGKYTYGTQATDWGPQLTQTVTGDLIWAYDIDGDSLCNHEIVTDLTGKMALIRRGAESDTVSGFFSRKVWQAQQKGAIGAIICNHYDDVDDTDGNLVRGMAAANEAPWDSLAAEVTIPAIFISRNTAEKIQAAYDAGSTVNVSFAARAFANPLHAYSYHTPQSAIVPLKDMGIRFINLLADTLPELTLTLEITDPANQKTTINETVTNIPGYGVYNHTFSDPYLPQAIGEYRLKYTNSETPDSFERKFVITDYTFAQDDNVITPNTNGTIEPSEDNFVNVYEFNYDIGNFYRTGSQGLTATHVTFLLGNPDEIYTGEVGTGLFKIRIYNADPDGNGSVPDGHFPTLNALDENGGTVSAIGFTDYALGPEVQPFDLITLELNAPVTLQPNGIYLAMVRYNGQEGANVIPPKYGVGKLDDEVAGGLNTAIFVDSFRTEGWDGPVAIVRMHLDGFSGVDEKPLDNSKISLSPNPASTFVNLNLSLDQPAREVTVRILDFNGRLVSTRQFENIQNDVLPFDVGDLAVGTYFMSVSTPEGYRSKMFQVLR
ncbi:MAG: T9SS type A sorting domain-containing protein [Lewinellaceae bacterium]|nr:T9SS type A sorting domain-containing protein [Saprospiraceae bacterium]MCB9337487.1 T9SS type A sorting domain-containing protein [Lewinellaceae bacterium]